MVTEIQLLESAEQTPLIFRFWGLHKSKVY